MIIVVIVTMTYLQQKHVGFKASSCKLLSFEVEEAG